MGIEPTYPAWKAGVLPLNYTRKSYLFYMVCPEPESNQRHEDFQSSALPTELSGLIFSPYLWHVLYNTKSFAHCQELFLLPQTGIEPVREYKSRRILSPVRLPVPPLRQNGWRWIRTTESVANRFTVCPLWPLGNPSKKPMIGLEPITC